MCALQAMVVRAAACASLPVSQRAAPGSSVSNVPLARPALKAHPARTTATVCLARAPIARLAHEASGRTQAPASAVLTARREIWASPALQTAVSAALDACALLPEVSTTASGSFTSWCISCVVTQQQITVKAGMHTLHLLTRTRRLQPLPVAASSRCCCWVHTDCPPGTYGSDCLPCTPGSWCPGGKQAPITACGPNRFSAAAAKSAGDCYCVPGAIRAGIGWRAALWCRVIRVLRFHPWCVFALLCFGSLSGAQCQPHIQRCRLQTLVELQVYARAVLERPLSNLFVCAH